MIFRYKRQEAKQRDCMRKSSVFVLLVYSLFASDDVMLPPYTEAFSKGALEVLEIDSEINWENSGISDEEALEYCKNTQSLPKDSKQMEQYLKQHTIVWSLHYYSGGGCIYRGKVRFAGKIWDFISIGGKTTFSRENENISLVCVTSQCYPRAWSDEE